MNGSDKKYRFGFDVGAASLGWSVYELDEQGEICRLERIGSRIFSDGRDPKTLATLGAERSSVRQARRQRDRFKQRQKYVLSELEKARLFPPESAKEEREKLKNLDPLELRAKALHEKLKPYELGRALFHINQRRGFQSNRKDQSEERTSGKLAEASLKLLAQMQLMQVVEKDGLTNEELKKLPPEEQKAIKERRKEARLETLTRKEAALKELYSNDELTFGSFLWERKKNKQSTRVRPASDGKSYDFYPTRDLLKDEFTKILKKQRAFNPKLLSDEEYVRIEKAIFSQRPLKSQQDRIGLCSFLFKIGEKRAFRALPSLQLYRIIQEVNNLSWHDDEDGVIKLVGYPELRGEIIELLKRPTAKTGMVTFGTIKKLIKKEGLLPPNAKLSLESDKRTGLMGDRTALLMREYDLVGGDWDKWSIETQDEFIQLLMGDEEEESILQSLQNDFGLDADRAQLCLDEMYRLESGTAHLSLRAARLITAKMRDDCVLQHKALTLVKEDVPEFHNPLEGIEHSELRDRLPYYGEAFAGSAAYTKPSEQNDTDLKRRDFGAVANPTVHISLNQIRNVTNELIRLYGNPESIAIELARDLPLGAEGKRELESNQRKNQNNNERLDAILREHGVTVNHDNRLKLKLWEELGTNPTDRRCPFSGNGISIHQLFSDEVEIEHLIPKHISLDNSPANLTVCMREANRMKKGHTPYEAFGEMTVDGYDWEDIVRRSENLPNNKAWRFRPDAMERWQRDHGDLLARHLNDTAYIGRLAKDYLALICPFNKIDVVTGKLTSALRHEWGLNSLLHAEDSENKNTKNREDHRHHALDAAVIGATTRSLIQRVSTAASDERDDPTSLFPRWHNRVSTFEPWPGFQADTFRDDVKEALSKTVVSHRSRTKYPSKRATTGKLHDDNRFGISKDRHSLFKRRSIDQFKTLKHLQEILDPILREELIAAFNSGGIEAVQDLAKVKNIRRLKCEEKFKTVPKLHVIENFQNGRDTAVSPNNNWAMEIYEFPKGHKKAGHWQGRIITHYEANQPNFQLGVTYRPHPQAKLVMRAFIDDCLILEGQERPVRVYQITHDSLYLAGVNEANVAARNIGFKRSAEGLRRANARKVHISPTGLVNLSRNY